MGSEPGAWDDPTAATGWRQRIGWIVGISFLLMTLVVPPPAGLETAGWRTAGVTLLMATFWICECIPIPATALLPLALFPLLGLGSIKDVAAPFAHPLVFLFMGGFILALGMERWNLHRRLAIGLLSCMGTRQKRVIAGFLLASAFISMWVSNTATALMMLPIAMSVIQLIPEENRTTMRPFMIALLLAVAYGATTGGMATLIGTPPNALLAGYADKQLGIQLGFAQWMIIGVPVALVSLTLVYWVLTRVSFRVSNDEMPGMAGLLAEQRQQLGRFSRGELIVAVVFITTALGWVFQPLIAKQLPMLSDTVIAMIGALALFCIPVEPRRGVFAMDWQTAKRLPWDVLLLFGGGLSLAGAIETHKLAAWLGGLSGNLDVLPVVLVMAVIAFAILMLTELTSNTATAATFLPVVAAVAIGMDCAPLLFLIPTALAANCSYMMPVGTPPNAIVFGSGLIRLPEMARAGLLLNLLMVPVIVVLVMVLGKMAFGVSL
ncbi:MAG: DASS family sodium-coupled anion symporter [Planctomycetes bacterium]|nr:DASS family sodium-coupled anion symporter [Planctomycetota bacterium]